MISMIKLLHCFRFYFIFFFLKLKNIKFLFPFESYEIWSHSNVFQYLPYHSKWFAPMNYWITVAFVCIDVTAIQTLISWFIYPICNCTCWQCCGTKISNRIDTWLIMQIIIILIVNRKRKKINFFFCIEIFNRNFPRHTPFWVNASSFSIVLHYRNFNNQRYNVA